MNDDIEVSVWCTCYNHEKYIKQCLDGFVSQKTNFKYEVIVHDDASTDRSPAIIKEYAEKYPDIIKPIFQTENQYSKNVDLEKEFFVPNIKGKYVAFCEGDDYWCHGSKLQVQRNIMSCNAFKCCFHSTRIVDENGEDVKDKSYPPLNENKILSVFKGLFPIECIMYFILNGMCKIHISSCMFKADDYIKYVLNPPKYTDSLHKMHIGDAPLMSYFSTIGNAFYVPVSLSCYRDSHAGSFTHENAIKMKRDKEYQKKMIDSWKTFYNEFNEFTNNKYKWLLIDSNPIFNLFSEDAFTVKPLFDKIRNLIPHLLDYKASFDNVLNLDKTFIRFDENDLNLIFGYDSQYQRHDIKLQILLHKILMNEDSRFEIGICGNLFYDSAVYNKIEKKIKAPKINSEKICEYMEFLNSNKITLFSSKRRYIDSCIFTPYKTFNEEKISSDDIFNKAKTFFKDKKVLLVIGDEYETYFSNDNGIFSNAASLNFCKIKLKNSFSSYDSLLSELSNVEDDVVICMACGPVGKVLAFDLRISRNAKCIDVECLLQNYHMFVDDSKMQNIVEDK